MKKKYLVIVESPTKAKTIRKFLNSNYKVAASMGHLIDLPKSQLGIEIENNFKPKYITIRGKGDILKSLKEAGKAVDKVFLATDPDREGEAICWHLSEALKLNKEEPNRIQFNEITRNAVQEAIKNPGFIDFNRVEAQQARRILDRMVGYKISPLLWKKVKKGLSAGRVQSVAVYLICEREKEIENFVSEEYWTIDAELSGQERETPFKSRLVRYANRKVNLKDRIQAEKAVEELQNLPYVVNKITSTRRKRKPAPPFTTSSLQQEAAQRLGFSSKRTMRVAQQLYEGISLAKSGRGKEMTGLITYIRTDSVRVSAEAQQQARRLIERKFGADYLPDTLPYYKSRKGAQDAHEAIRPSGVENEPDQIKVSLSRDQYRLYKLIWNRFLASQMASALVDQVRIDILADEYQFRTTGSSVKFPGFLLLYEDLKSKEDEENKTIPKLEEGRKLNLLSLLPEQHFTQPPPRYNEASLIKVLEEKGIGRPSTYSPIIETIQSRGYVNKEEKVFRPTRLGNLVVELLKEFFPEIVDTDFTARLEEKLDNIEEGKLDSLVVLQDFFISFTEHLRYAEEQMQEIELEPEYSEEKCPHCGKNLVYKEGRFGRFLACPGFPECRFTKKVMEDTGVPCPCGKGTMVKRRTRKGRIFYGCSRFPECDYTTWKKPLPQNCPRCNHFMVEENRRDAVCGNPGCPLSKKQKVAITSKGD